MQRQRVRDGPLESDMGGGGGGQNQKKIIPRKKLGKKIFPGIVQKKNS
jgi:hypothetical protein